MVSLHPFTVVVLGSLMACSLAGAPATERTDPRVRTYLTPTRIVTTTGTVVASERLLGPKYGQVCERQFGQRAGCLMTNKGTVPSMLLDFGRELHGSLQLGISPGAKGQEMRVHICLGESVSEALSTLGEKHACNDHALRDLELNLPRFGSIEVGQSGFRFARIDLITPGTVGFEFIRAVSLMRPLKAIGSFRSSDERLNCIFDTALRTVHLCCQEYIWDGIKRDRLVWMGDLHPETKAILSVYGAVDVLPDSLDYIAATTPPTTWMNTLPTYSLWWIRNLAEWYRYTGDRAYLAQKADYLEQTFDHICTGLDSNNLWTAGVFLDWPTKHNPQAATAGTQGLALMTARDTLQLANVLNRPNLAAKAKRLADVLSRQHPDPHGAKSAAALLALSGLRTPREMFTQVLGQKGHADVSTFYGYYMLEAMSAANEHQRALDTVRDYWGAMLDVGATSFWENFDLTWTNNCFRIDELPVPGKKDIHGDYGEFCYPGLRHSLCHGWSGGPVPWCLEHILGIEPVGVGSTQFRVHPFLGDLDWAEGCYALPNGQALYVKAYKNKDGQIETVIKAPKGVTILKGRQ